VGLSTHITIPAIQHILPWDVEKIYCNSTPFAMGRREYFAVLQEEDNNL
jgi:hypothetical protein